MKKVAIVINSAWPAYNFRLNLARHLKNSGYEVVFLTKCDKKYSELIKKEFKFYDLYIDPKGINPIIDFKTMVDIYKAFKEIRPDIVLNFSIKPNIYSSIVAGLMKIKSISNITGLGTIFIKQSPITKIAKILYKVALSFNQKVFFQNRDDRDLFINNNLVDKNKTDLLPGSGVDLNKFKPVKKEQDSIFRFLLIARLLRDKGVLEYIEAIKILKNRYKNIEFQILGEVGVENKTAISKDELQSWIDDGLIKYLGVTDSVESVIKSVDCVILPSYREGTPRSLLEASAMQKPIVATNVVGCKEVVDDGINGFLCEVKNANDLANKMKIILELSEEKRVKMGEAGREKVVKKFDEVIVLNKYLKSVEKILKQ